MPVFRRRIPLRSPAVSTDPSHLRPAPARAPDPGSLRGAPGLLTSSSGSAAATSRVSRAALPPGKISHILVIELENEGYAATFGAGSPATYLNGALRSKGELLQNYYATGHASLDNYIAQVSGQAPTLDTQADCADNGFAFADVAPGTPDADQAANPGQVDGQGCVYPTSVATIASQLDAKYAPNKTTHVAAWRAYEQDMGNTPSRDGGTADASGGTDCGHPAIGTTDTAEVATPADQYTTRHDPFVWFHSVIDNTAECNCQRGSARHVGQQRTPFALGPSGEGSSQREHHAAVRLHHSESLQRRTRRDLRRSQQHRRSRRGPHRGRPVPARLDAPDPRLTRLQARRHARGRHLRRGRPRRTDRRRRLL